MGLDVSVRYVRRGAVPDITGEYSDDDIKDIGCFFNGRFDFEPLKNGLAINAMVNSFK